MAEKKSGYISARESRAITRYNRKITRLLEARREKAGADPAAYTVKMRDDRNIVEFDNVCTYFFTDAGTVKAVDGVSFDIPRHSTVGVVGESGCGKSVTSLSLMQLLQRPMGQIVGGQIRYNKGDGTALNIAAMPNSGMEKLRGDRMSMIFQEPMTSLNPVMKLGRQVDEVMLTHHSEMPKEQVMARTLEMLDLVGIADPKAIYHKYAHELSGGMRQRVMIAIALACSPEIIIADEPTTALDVTIQAQILDLLENLKQKFSSSIMLITHDLGIVAGMADYVVVMYAGRVVEKGTTDDIFHRPAHPYTIGLMKSKPVIGHGTKTLYNIPGSVPNPINMPNYCYFRDRCESRCGACDGRYPPEIRISETHTVSCYRFADTGETANYPESVDLEALING